MALIKSNPTPYGIPAEYHKIMEIRINWHANDASVLVGTFVNKEARMNNANCVIARLYEFPTRNFPFNMDHNNVDEAYLALKQHPDFTDAEDDI